MDSDHATPAAQPFRAPRPWLRIISLAAIAVGIGLWIDMESGFSLLRGTTPARGVMGIVGLGLLAVGAELTADAIIARDKTSDSLARRVAHLTLLLSGVAVFVALVWLWSRVLGVAQ